MQNKKRNQRVPLTVATAAFNGFLRLAKADLSIFCFSKLYEGPARITSFQEYEVCDTTCECYAFELLCLERNESGIYTLESTSYEQVQDCSAAGSCICNYQSEEIWQSTANANDGVPLPAAIEVALPTFNRLERRAQSGNANREYERDLYNELSSATTRADHVVIHPINEEFYGELPDYKVSPDVATIDTNCTDKITCDLYYELDWSVRLRQEMECSAVVALDPCFATNACVCDTGYFRISETMPEAPTADEEKADSEVIEIENFQEKLDEAAKTLAEIQEQEALAKAQLEQENAENNSSEGTGEIGNEATDGAATTEDGQDADSSENGDLTPNEEAVTQVEASSSDDGFETWQYIVAICGLVIVLLLIGIGIYFAHQKCRRRKGIHSVKPQPFADAEMGNQAAGKGGKRKDDQLEKNNASDKVILQSEMRDPYDVSNNNPVAPTDDEKSNNDVMGQEDHNGINREGSAVKLNMLEEEKAFQPSKGRNTFKQILTTQDGAQTSDRPALPDIHQARGPIGQTMADMVDANGELRVSRQSQGSRKSKGSRRKNQ